MNLDSALLTFIAESRELLGGMDDALLELERDPGNADAIGATFRAVHTIKGSGGLFGLDDIVAFAHVVENVLDRARADEIPIDDGLTALLLECGDHLGRLVDAAAGSGRPASDECGQCLLARLRQYAPPATATATATAVTAAPEGGVPAASDNWHISLRFNGEVLQNGMDPAAFLRYLATLGELRRVTTLWEGMPAAAEMDPERCYLGFEISFRGAVDRDMLEGAFEFVRDDCQLRIVPPHSPLDAYLRLLDELPEGPERIGEILLASGAVSQAELAAGRARQAADAPPRPLDPAAPRPPAVAGGERAGRDQPQGREPGKDKRAGEASFVRVDAAKLDELIDQVGELVIAGASANLLGRRSGDSALHEAMSIMGRLVEEIRDRALSLRMVEIGDTFHRFQRVVRDVSRELGKDIELRISGADTELDKTLIEKINDPLLHLVRNAIDHGIEPSETRLAHGKPARGCLRLDARHESGSIVIEVSDDGGGLDRERILAKARERGLVGAEQTLSEQETLQLIFEPGFSTAAAVSNLSGRGVGMDVVKRNIALLRGSVELMSQPGQGTTVRIRMPLTLAIIDGFLVEVGDRSFVVPLETVRECLELPRGDGATPLHYLKLRDEVLPFIRLREALAIAGPAPARENVVVVRAGGHKAGLVVDRLLGEFQTVIKPLGIMFRHLQGIAGSTILGSGEVAMILDVPLLIDQAIARETEGRPGAHPAAPLVAH